MFYEEYEEGVKLSCSKSWRLRGGEGMECLASTLTLTSGTIRMAELSGLCTGCTLFPRNSVV